MSATWAEAIAQRNALRYASYVYDAHCGLYYLQRRHYDPITRQFLSRDPLRSDGDESPYQYCAGDPVAATDPWGLYVTASGERDDPQIYIPQTGYVVAKGVGTGHHGALGGDTSDLYLPWQGSLGSLSTPGLADRALQGTGQFLRTGLELAAFLCGDPWAHPFGDDPNAEMGASAALMFVDPFAGTSGALRSGAGLIDDVARGVGAGARGIGSLSRAGEFGIMSYREMRVAKAGTGLQAHHLIESRFKDVVREKAGDMLSIAVTPAEHQKFTNAWRSEIAYGTDYKSVSPERVEAAARKVYGQYPDILSALGL